METFRFFVELRDVRCAHEILSDIKHDFEFEGSDEFWTTDWDVAEETRERFEMWGLGFRMTEE